MNVTAAPRGRPKPSRCEREGGDTDRGRDGAGHGAAQTGQFPLPDTLSKQITRDNPSVFVDLCKVTETVTEITSAVIQVSSGNS